MSTLPSAARQGAAPPRIVAISGVLFAVLFVTSLVLLRQAVPAHPAESGAWLADASLRGGVQFALNLVPFTGIAFLWFMAVLRNRIGLFEDRFFATIFLGSGLLFVAMLFVAVSVARGLVDTFASADLLSANRPLYTAGRTMTYALMNVFGIKMAAVFMFVTSTIGLRTGVLARWVSYAGFLLGLVLLFVITDFAWIALLFPLWVLLVSTYILIADFLRAVPDDGRGGDAGVEQSAGSEVPKYNP